MHGPRGATYRLALVLIAAIALNGLAWSVAFAGLSRCYQTILPGDEAWMRLYLARKALSVLFGGLPQGCVIAAGAGLVAVAPKLALAGVGLFGAAALWELAGWRLRLWTLGLLGGHAVLAGRDEDLGSIAGPRNRLWLTLGDAHFPGLAALFRHCLPFPALRDEAREAARLGLGQASILVAATADDLANFRLARAALAAGFGGKLVVRLDGRSLRGLAVDALRGAKGAAEIVIAAPGIVQAREALRLAMPGGYVDETAGLSGPVRFAICGDGPGIDPMAALLARQGFGLETFVPQLAILRVGGRPAPSTDPPVPDEVMQISHRDVTNDDPERLDGAIAALVSGGARLSAIFCLGSTPGMAGLLASRWVRVLGDLGLTVPPLVALEATGGDQGLVTIARRPGLAEVDAWQSRLDARAEKVHAHYLSLVEGAPETLLPARKPWADLAERYREDSRAAADHIGYKLALCGLVARPFQEGTAVFTAAAFTANEIDRLARIEHARWCAARLVAGWRLGPRDDVALLHPDLLPFDSLDAATREKDRDQVARLSAVLALGGEAMLRLLPVRPGGMVLDPADRQVKVLAALRALAQANPGYLPLLRLTLADGDPALAQAVQAAGFPVELVLADTDDAGQANAAPLRHLAERIRVVADPGLLAAQTAALLTETGEAHVIHSG